MRTDTRVLATGLRTRTGGAAGASRRNSLALVLGLAACSVPPPPHAPANDTGVLDAYREDAGTVVVRDMGPRDTGVRDTGPDTSVDAPGIDAGNDAGPPLQITIDGTFTEDFWTTAGVTTNGTPADARFAQRLTALHYGRDGDWLYLGFESDAPLTAGDAVVVYVDTHFGDGVMLATGLGDGTNVVNQVLSLQIIGTAEFQPEFGWGTAMMPHSVGPTDTTLGWRQLAMNPGPVTNVPAGNRSACSATGCETAMLLAQIGVPFGGYLRVVARLGRPGVGPSNQTFPVIDSSTPETITDSIAVPAS